ncbi:DUF1907-domain-containing protein [Aspergillus steynii IBT 23096]|uniref:DUF1907-domain-containing protein n=1 Tax=Aspergillus steynii IBT 23096 TaxID=1392250 RepID=A0A2I2GI04_9EURO|nr:DUF1907-domain-containing protein [Aspergillus steynii IBT 23096]PLB52477.1 DUF1907-domain-containing protein [Aspergillus steynii IBT 23096]
MHTNRHELSPPSLTEIAQVLASALSENYASSWATVVECPDLRQAPFNLACEGLSGAEVIADIGGQANLFPQPRLEKNYSLIKCAEAMGMIPTQGSLIGAGAGPNHVHGVPSELAPNLCWKNGFENVNNMTRSARLIPQNEGSESAVACPYSGSTDYSLMMNLYGSHGLPGQVVKVTARGRRGDAASFSEFLRSALRKAYGEDHQISLGGTFIMKRGKAKFHVMPPFPPQDELPFKSQEALDGWLSYQTFSGPMVCLSVFHSADPKRLGVRLEHTHCFNGDSQGGHYHYDISSDDNKQVEYEGYFNTAKTFVQIDKP